MIAQFMASELSERAASRQVQHQHPGLAVPGKAAFVAQLRSFIPPRLSVPAAEVAWGRMKPMKTTPLLRSVSAMFIAASLTIAPAVHAEEPALSEVLSRHAELLNELAKAVAAAGQEAAGAKKTDAAPLKTAGLHTSSLERSGLAASSVQGSSPLSGSGTGSLAVGLTPLEQWRVFFPDKK